MSGRPDKAKREWMRGLPCLVCRALPCDPAHVKARGAGGTDAEMVPLCGPDYRFWREGHHAQQHRIGVRSFERMYAKPLDHRTLRDHAADYEAMWQMVKERLAAQPDAAG